ncbi:hypothetical protein LIA77_03060 [Sarocladium implicatum]|nr:hypothetical protein LIA77_03060 [Sarocladium implicatum]
MGTRSAESTIIGVCHSIIPRNGSGLVGCKCVCEQVCTRGGGARRKGWCLVAGTGGDGSLGVARASFGM